MSEEQTINAIFVQLQRIDAILTKIMTGSGGAVAGVGAGGEETGGVKELEDKLPEITALVMTTQEALRLTWRLAAIFNRMGLPDKVGEAIQTVSTLSRAVMYLYYALNLLQRGTPYGIIAGILGIVNIGMMGAEQELYRQVPY